MTDQKPVILIIDDEELMRSGCKQALERIGCTVLTAKDGAEGLRLAREHKPDAAFVDFKMPGMSGMELIEILSKEIPEMVLIMITGYASIGSAVESIHKGAFDFLPKPFSPDQLRTATRRVLEHRNMKIEANRLREEKAQMEKGFITFVSHEMRSPLVVIRQSIEALKMIGEDRFDDQVRELFEKCDRRIKGLEEMIEHWLDISRIGQGTFTPKQDSLSTAGVLERSIDELSPICRKNGIDLETTISENVLKLTGDEESLVRVFSNIIGNATKYTPPGGKISISARSEGRSVKIVISDTGKGIPEDKLPYIFDPFYRVKGKDEVHRGSGLGLTYCKKIVESHGGKIQASSKEGEGTTFELTFPGHIDSV